MRRLLALMIFSAGCGAAIAETPAAPFGLSWGQSRAAVEASGVTLDDCTGSGTVETCLARDLGWAFEDDGTYRLFFDEAEGLGTIRYRSERVFPDRRGVLGRAIHDRIRVRIEADYGESRRREKIFQSPPYQLETQFYECLRQGARCGVWSAEWRGRGISLELRAVAVTEGEGGYVDLVFYGPATG